MQVILLQRVAKLGQMGDVVRVKDGYARNFLLPGGKALRLHCVVCKPVSVSTTVSGANGAMPCTAWATVTV